MKCVKAKIIKTINGYYENTFLVDCIGEEMIKKYFKNNEPMRILDDNKCVGYLNPRYIVSYVLYTDLCELEED